MPASGSGGRPQGRVRQARSAPSRPTADACLALRASNDEAFSTWACPADLIRRARFGILSAHAARPLRRPSAVSPRAARRRHQPAVSAIELIAAHCHGYPCVASTTIRTVSERCSGEQLLERDMSYIHMEPSPYET